jgi:hypothetical protein
MVLYPASLVLLALWAALTYRNAGDGMLVAIAALPFGMFAAIEASGMSLRAAHLAAVLTMAVCTLQYLNQSRDDRALRLSPAGLALMAFAVYGIISATLLVRVFEGQVMVFPVSLDAVGPAISHSFGSTTAPLRPSSSNISQLAYVLVACAFFLYLESLVRRNGLHWAEGALVVTALINIVLAVLDLIGADLLLEPVRTADYALLNEQAVQGLARIVGGFSEPAAFGAFSAALFGYFAMSFLIGRRPLHGGLAAASLACALMSLSTSAIAAAACSLIFLVLHLRHVTGSGLPQGFAQMVIAALAAFVAIFVAAMMLTPLADTLWRIIDQIFLSKAQSHSGLERRAWAMAGIDAFWATFGLGGGIGSMRTNGLLSTLLGNVGLPGLTLYALFLWFAFGRRAPAAGPDTSEARRVYLSARIGALTALSTAMLVAVVPEPGLLLMTFAAIAAASWQTARDPAARASAPDARPLGPARGLT